MLGVDLETLRRLNGTEIPMPSERSWRLLTEDYVPLHVPTAGFTPTRVQRFSSLAPLAMKGAVRRLSITPGLLPTDPNNGRPRNPRGATGISGGALWYPVNPSVTAFVRHENDILLVQLPNGLWAPPGGFLKTNRRHTKLAELVLIGALRELLEESGITLDQNIKAVFHDQTLPDDPRDSDDRWVEDQIVFMDASGISRTELHPQHCGVETTDARWFSLGDAPLDQMSFYFANHVEIFRRELGQQAIIVA